MYYFTGIVMILAGIFINYTIRKRRFNRRGPGGLQHFKTYSGSIVIRFCEMLAKWVGIALILLGIGVIATGYRLNEERKLKNPHGTNHKKLSHRSFYVVS